MKYKQKTVREELRKVTPLGDSSDNDIEFVGRSPPNTLRPARPEITPAALVALTGEDQMKPFPFEFAASYIITFVGGVVTGFALDSGEKKDVKTAPDASSMGLTCTRNLLLPDGPTYARIITDTATGARVLVVADQCAVVLPPIPSAPVEKPPATKGTEP
jgi:hypothetical protein